MSICPNILLAVGTYGWVQCCSSYLIVDLCAVAVYMEAILVTVLLVLIEGLLLRLRYNQLRVRLPWRPNKGLPFLYER
jgi:hypothetical protein